MRTGAGKGLIAQSDATVLQNEGLEGATAQGKTVVDLRGPGPRSEDSREAYLPDLHPVRTEREGDGWGIRIRPVWEWLVNWEVGAAM